MNAPWKIAALSALGGAILSLAVVFGAALTGNFPGANGEAIHAYLLAHPEVIAEAGDKAQADQEANDDKARQNAVDHLGMSAFFDPKIAFVTGPADAKTTLVEFFDYNCPFCRASIPAVRAFYEKHKSDARFAFIEFPIKGPQSIIAARAAIAARKQPDKYVAFHFALMNEEGLVDENLVYQDAAKVGLDVDELKKDMSDPETDKAVQAALGLAHKAHVDGTPAFIVDGHVREGAVDEDILRQMSKG